MKKVTDPEILKELEGSSGGKVTDPALLAELEGKPQTKTQALQEKLLARPKVYSSVEELRKANLPVGSEVELSTGSGRQRVKVLPGQPTFMMEAGEPKADSPLYASADEIRKATGKFPLGAEVALSTETGRQKMILRPGYPHFSFQGNGFSSADAADNADAAVLQPPMPGIPLQGTQAPQMGLGENIEQSQPIKQPPNAYRESVRASLSQVIPGFSVFPQQIQDAIMDKAEQMGVTPTTAMRGMRGLGVGVQRLIEGDAPGQALDRSAAAVQPGYQPQPGERIGAAAGESIALAPVFAATGGGGLMAQAGKGMLTSGTVTAIQEAADRGDVSVGDVVFSSVIGGGIPILFASPALISRVMRAGSKVTATAGTNLSREAVDELANDRNLLKNFKGTAEAVGEKVVKIQKALIGQHEKVADYLKKVRSRAGIQEPFEDSLERVSKDGFSPRTPSEIVTEFKRLAAGKASTASDTVMPSKSVDLPVKERLRDLYRLRESIDDIVNFSKKSADVNPIGKADDGFLKSMRGKVNEIIETIPGGKVLRMADEAYHLSRKLYDNLQKKLATQGQAEQAIQQIVRGGDINEVIGLKGDNLRLLQSLERKTGKKLLGPVQKELAAKSFRNLKATGGSVIGGATGVMKEAIGGENLAGALNLVNRGVGLGEMTARGLGHLSPFMQAALGVTRRPAEQY